MYYVRTSLSYRIPDKSTKISWCLVLRIRLCLIYSSPVFQDVHVMIFIGFGFLMTFLKKLVFHFSLFNQPESKICCKVWPGSCLLEHVALSRLH